MNCPETSEGLSCRKRLTQMSNGDWVHGGGHWFASEATEEIMKTHHIDAKALLSGLPATHHAPEDCPGAPDCYWEVDHD